MVSRIFNYTIHSELVMEFTRVFACSTSSEALKEWKSHIVEQAEQKGIAYKGPSPHPPEDVQGTTCFRTTFRFSATDRVREILDTDPPDEVYIRIGFDYDTFELDITEVLPEEELIERGVLDPDQESDSVSTSEAGDVGTGGVDQAVNTEGDEDGEAIEDGSEAVEHSESENGPLDSHATADKPDTAVTQTADLEKNQPVDTGEMLSSTADLDTLRQKAHESAVKNVPNEATTTSQEVPQYNRSSDVKAYVKARADGVCEGCGEPAPFTSKTGDPDLHAHHIYELSEGGSDTPDTVVALCPNCHYRVHHGKDGDEYNQELLNIVQEKEISDN